MSGRINLKTVFNGARYFLIALVLLTFPGIGSGVSMAQFEGGDMYAELENEYLSITPSVPEYTIEPDLSNVVNLSDFDDQITPGQMELLASNGFVVTPSDSKQIFWIYERNDYHEPNIPSFITTDSMLHTYHFFFDYVLRKIETDKLIPVLRQLTEAMLSASEEDLAATEDLEVQEAALRNVAFFAVARNLLDGTPPPESVEEMVLSDLGKIEDHERRSESAILDPVLVDFTQFIPRGHYTRTEELEKYFKAMMWYGLVPLLISEDDEVEGMRSTRQSLMIARNLEDASYDGIPALELWETIYEPTTFFVGETDNLNVYDCIRLMHEVYGPNPSTGDFADVVNLKEFISLVLKLPGPGIKQFVPVTADQEASGSFTAGALQFNFMGQRFIPDSRILQELVHDKVFERLFPTGLDVFAAMGSDRALDILQTYYNVDAFQGYDTQMEKMRTEMSETTQETWQSNLYYGWLWSLKSIITPASEGYPAFMRNDAWLDKSLFTALGSWTELRHDTVLYARQSGVECGSDYEEPPPPKSYVEPNIEFWTKLLWLVEYTQDGLDARGLSDEMLTYRFEWLADLVSFCRGVVIKELTNVEVTEDEYRRMQYYGASLEGLMLSLAGGDLISDADKDSAVVVDIHNAFGDVLQEATGRIGAIFVVVPIEGELYLTRGGVFIQYEFVHPASDRLTDEKWREILDAGEAPPLAEWTDSFIVETETPMVFEYVSSGC